MKKSALLFAVSLVLLFSGCAGKTSGGSGAGSGNNPVSGESTSYASDGAVSETVAGETVEKFKAQQKNTSDGAVSETAAGPNQTNASMVEIKEKLFIGQLNDIYLNQKSYLGKIIKYEGIFTQYTWVERGITYYSVYRNSPGCCGADGQAGFGVIWPEGSKETYPNENDWCEVVGTLESYVEDGQTYLRIRLDSLTVKSERGAEFVNQ